MHNFKDFDIKPRITAFVGDKIKVKNLLGVEITVIGYKIEPSKQKKDSQLLTLQIEKSGEKRVVFTGSVVLIDQIKRVPESSFPFVTTIRGDNEFYEFT